MKIRLAQNTDAPQMAALLNEIIRIGGTTAFQKETTPELMVGFIISLAGKGFVHVAVDETDGSILGYQSLERYSTLPKTVGVIATFAKVGATQRGIGSALFAATRAAALQIGFTEIDATIRADNTGGLAYYSKMGFQNFEIHKDVPLDDGTLVDRISKRLTL